MHQILVIQRRVTAQLCLALANPESIKPHSLRCPPSLSTTRGIKYDFPADIFLFFVTVSFEPASQSECGSS
jgi:hypothetical protein